MTKIQWATHTFNPWRGCTKVSPGCAHCYADTGSKRNPLVLGVWGPQGTRVVASEAKWREPVKWDREAEACQRMNAKHFPGLKHERPRVFCASIADVFEDWAGPMVGSKGDIVSHDSGDPPWRELGAGKRITMQDVRARLFRLIDSTPNLDWLLLTKRPEKIAKMMMVPERGDCYHVKRTAGYVHLESYLPNVWLGTSVENKAAKLRIDTLRGVPAAIRFLSIEPLLENVGTLDLTGISWVIVGGESGPSARPCQVEWIRSVVRQCKAAEVPVFVKQLGGYVVDRNDRGFEAENERWAEGPHENEPTDPEAWPTPVDVEHDLDGTRDGYQGAPVRVHLVDKKGGDPEEWPLDLRVRAFPKVPA